VLKSKGLIEYDQGWKIKDSQRLLKWNSYQTLLLLHRKHLHNMSVVLLLSYLTMFGGVKHESANLLNQWTCIMGT
jgi:hypothetical protein